jgi:hypothetical protein
MIFSDDDDIFISPSDSMSFEGPENAKNKIKEEKAKSKGKLFALKRMLLRGKVEDKKGMRMQENEYASIDEKSHEETREQKSSNIKTQKQTDKIISADENLTTDELVEKSYREEARKEDLNQETASEDV